MTGTVAIARYPSFGADVGTGVIVAVDVIRATTTAVTAVAAGRRCFPVPSIEMAVPLAGRLENPLLVGELGGNKPYGFHLQNSPVEMNRRVGLDRPVILLSTSGTRILCEAATRGRTFAACLRNASAQAEYLAAEHEHVVLLGGETRGEFRDEDRLCCARIARDLLRAGFDAGDAFTEELVKRWGDAPDNCIVDGHSAEYLASTGQRHDLEFILDHIDDLHAVFELRERELVMSDAW
jgi:2-phosphosulfolactate phosphatase